MKRLSLPITVVVLLGIAAASRAAESAQSLALARQLLDAMQIERTFEEQGEAVREAQAQMFAQLSPPTGRTPEETARYDKLQKEVGDLFRKEFSWEATRNEFAAVYVSTFSDEEMRGLIAFYESPLGRALVAKTPELTAKTMEISQRRMQAILPRIRALIMERMPAPTAD